MATKYTMQEMPDLRGDGTHKLYPRMVIVGRRTLDDIAGEVAIGSTFSRGEIVGVITSFVQEMATQMSRGYSVSIDGLGTFTPALGLADGKEAEQVDGGKRINAQSVKVSDINFRADRAIVIDTVGVKRVICERCEKICRDFPFTFVGCHPMAGTQFSGFAHARATMFKGAPMVVVTTARGPWKLCPNMDCPGREKKAAAPRRGGRPARQARARRAALPDVA